MNEETEDAQTSGTETDRRTLLRTAGLAGAAGAALAGAMHGKFSLAPISEAQAQTIDFVRTLSNGSAHARVRHRSMHRQLERGIKDPSAPPSRF